MKRFIKLTVLFLIPVILFLFGIGFLADGTTDPFYLRFTSPPQKNLIVGTSKAAQGIQPEVLKKELGIAFYNYAFTVSHSPYGRSYFESIKKKHKKEKGGTFIVTVDPWSISSYCQDPNDETKFRENTSCVAITENVNAFPNYEYLYKNLDGNYRHILIKANDKILLHNDGWLEVFDIDMSSEEVQKRVTKKVKNYRSKYLQQAKLSQVRLHYLEQTISYFKEYGKVYLIRLPVSSSIYAIENELMPDFDSIIEPMIEMSNGYLDMTPFNEEFNYTDGNHLYSESGAKASQFIANWMNGVSRNLKPSQAE